MKILASLLLIPGLLVPFHASGQAADNASHVFTGTLVSVQAGPVGMSFPPMYTWTFTVRVTASQRGDFAAGTNQTLVHSLRTEHPPAFREGRR